MMMIRRRMEIAMLADHEISGGGHSLFGKLVFLVFELNSDQAIVIGWLKSSYFLNARVRIFQMPFSRFCSFCASRVLILSRASEFIIILCSPHSTIEGPRELSQNRTRTPANKIGFRFQGLKKLFVAKFIRIFAV